MMRLSTCRLQPCLTPCRAAVRSGGSQGQQLRARRLQMGPRVDGFTKYGKAKPAVSRKDRHENALALGGQDASFGLDWAVWSMRSLSNAKRVGRSHRRCWPARKKANKTSLGLAEPVGIVPGRLVCQKMLMNIILLDDDGFRTRVSTAAHYRHSGLAWHCRDGL